MNLHLKYLKRSILLFAAAWILLGFNPAHAQASINVANPTPDHVFGVKLTFQADLEPPAEPVSRISAVFSQIGVGGTTEVEATIDTDYHISAEYDLQPQDYLFPFVTIRYWFVVTLSSGSQLKSQEFTFQYTDNRFEWQTIEEPGLFRVHWNEGDISFAQSILDAAISSLDHFTQYLTLPQPDNLDIYVYADPADLQSAISLSGQNWIAGHANPELNLVLVSIPPGFDKQIEIERQVPHEITHIRLYQLLGDDFQRLPAWLNEGIASLAELYPNPDYRILLDNGYKNENLYTFSSLCDTFPPDTPLAYAQADAFLRYIYENYGSIGLQDLLEAYAEGYTCEKGVDVALGETLSQLEKDWQTETFGSAIISPVISALLPWILLTALIFIVPAIVIALSYRKPARG